MIYLNGRFMPIEEAMVPVLDRGFIFGDGVYEVLPAYSRHPFRLAEHLRRLQNSLDAIGLKNPYSDAEWAKLIVELIAHNEAEDQYIYLHITRGVAKRDHAFPKVVTPTVFMMSSPLPSPPPELKASGVTAITTQDNLWLRFDIKSISLLPNVLLRQQAVEAVTMEALLLRDGSLTEGAASNILVVSQCVLLAPPNNNLMLPGITYDLVLELAGADGMPTRVGPVAERRCARRRGGSPRPTREVLPITVLDGQTCGQRSTWSRCSGAGCFIGLKQVMRQPGEKASTGWR